MEVVVCETIERLIKNHGITPEDIDRTAILPIPYASLINLHKKRSFLVYLLSALIKYTFSRDFPQWSIIKPTIECPSNPEQIFPYFLATFCNNLNCITGFCTTHRGFTHAFFCLKGYIIFKSKPRLLASYLQRCHIKN